MSDYTPAATGTGARARIQRGGAFLAGMVMPNLGAFIAFGLITTLFIPDGWVNKIAGTQTLVSGQMSAVVGPLIVILIPILIAFTGGSRVYGHRGGVGRGLDLSQLFQGLRQQSDRVQRIGRVVLRMVEGRLY